MQVTPVLPWSFDFHARRGWEPVNFFAIWKGHGGKVDLRTQSFEAHILQGVGDPCLNFGNRPGLRIDPRCASQFGRILAASQSEGCRGFHPRYVLEADLLQDATANDLFPVEVEFERLRVVRVKDQE